MSQKTNSQITAMDQDIRQIEYTNKAVTEFSEQVNVQQYDITQAPQASELFDITYCRFVLHHIPQPSIGLEHKLKVVQTEHFRPLLSTRKLKRHHQLILEIFGNKFIDKGLITDNELNTLYDRVQGLVEDDDYVTDLFGAVFMSVERLT